MYKFFNILFPPVLLRILLF